MQKPGRAPLKNKNFEALTNGTPLRNDNDNDKEKKTGEKKKVKSYNVKTGKESTKKVKTGSPDDKLSKRLGSTLELESADQNKKSLTKKKSDPKIGGGVNRNKNATKSTTGIIGGNKKFKYISDGKVYVYEPGVQNNNPKTGRRL